MLGTRLIQAYYEHLPMPRGRVVDRENRSVGGEDAMTREVYHEGAPRNLNTAVVDERRDAENFLCRQIRMGARSGEVARNPHTDGLRSRVAVCIKPSTDRPADRLRPNHKSGEDRETNRERLTWGQ